MTDSLKLIFGYLIFPGLIFSAMVGMIACWIDRKVTARLQYRKGPPWYQPLADILKLLGKEMIVPEGVSNAVFLAAPLFGLSAAALVALILWQGNLDRSAGFIGDLIAALYLLTIPSLAMIIGGSSSRNPLSALGASREMKLILAYELPFTIAVFTIVVKAGSIMIGGVASHTAVLSVSGLIAFLVALLAAQAKMGFVPFDIAEAEQEIMAGPLLEYSGPGLALFKLTKDILFFVLPLFLITLFLGGIEVTTVAGIILAVLKYALILVLMVLIKNTNPRLKIDQAVRFFWGPVTLLAIAGFIFAVIGW